MQYSLPIHNPKNEYNTHDFIYTQCNAHLKVILSALPTSSGVNPYKNIVLIKSGPKSGKTHFSKVFQAATNATLVTPQDRELEGDYFIIDDIDKGFEESELFHIFNSICENNKIALFTATSLAGFKLKDLVSRLNSVRAFSVNTPDDEMMNMLLLKHLAARSLNVSIEAVQFLLKRIPRSFDAVFQYVNFIDAAALKNKRNISIHFLSSLEFPCDELL